MVEDGPASPVLDAPGLPPPVMPQRRRAVGEGVGHLEDRIVVGDDHLNFFAQDPSFGIEFFYCQFNGLHVDFAGSKITG